MDDTEWSTLFKQLVGLVVEEADKLAKTNGCSIRVLKQDGEEFMGTMDYGPNRINVEVVAGKVVAVMWTG